MSKPKIMVTKTKILEAKAVADFIQHIARMRDPYENGHSLSVSLFAVALARIDKMPEEDVDLLRIGCRLHDVGKILIPETILNKATRLTRQEWEMIHAHPYQGVEMLAPFDLHPIILDVIMHHHENLDGTGYPDKLKGKKISRNVRIVRICDSFDIIEFVLVIVNKSFVI